MEKVNRPDLRVFVVWEPVLASDWAPPNAAAQARIGHPGVLQFWDRPHALSAAIRAANDVKVLGEKRLKGAIVWDHIAVFPPGVRWLDRYPVPAYAGAPVLDIIDEAAPFLRE